VLKIDAAPERTLIHFSAEPPFDPMKLIQLVQADRRYRFAGPDRLRIDRPTEKVEERVQVVENLLARLR
jgi:transcription-repair coupling factor (superfamily II helicase)